MRAGEVSAAARALLLALGRYEEQPAKVWLVQSYEEPDPDAFASSEAALAAAKRELGTTNVHLEELAVGTGWYVRIPGNHDNEVRVWQVKIHSSVEPEPEDVEV